MPLSVLAVAFIWANLGQMILPLPGYPAPLGDQLRPLDLADLTAVETLSKSDHGVCRYAHCRRRQPVHSKNCGVQRVVFSALLIDRLHDAAFLKRVNDPVFAGA